MQVADEESIALTDELRTHCQEAQELRDKVDVTNLEAASNADLCEVAVAEAEEWQLQVAEADDQIEALKQAKAILSGAKFEAFLQAA